MLFAPTIELEERVVKLGSQTVSFPSSAIHISGSPFPVRCFSNTDTFELNDRKQNQMASFVKSLQYQTFAVSFI